MRVSVRHCTVGHLPVRVPVESCSVRVSVEHCGVRVRSRLRIALLVTLCRPVERTAVWVLILHLYY